MKACWRLEHCFQMAHSCSWKLVSVLAGWPQFLPQYGLVAWFLSITAWQSHEQVPQNKLSQRERQTHTHRRGEMEAAVAFGQTLESTYHQFCSTLFLGNASGTVAHIERMGN